MKCFFRLMFALIALMFPGIGNPEPAGEHEHICDESIYYDELHISIAEIHERVVNLQWPDPPPGARMRAYVVFQIKVSKSGEVCIVEFIGGNLILRSLLTPEIKKWKFLPNMPFMGLVAIRYASDPMFPESKGFQFL